MKRFAAVVLCCSLGAILPCAVEAGPVSINYGSQTLSGGFQAGNYSQVFNLQSGDLTLSYTIDLRNFGSADLPNNWTEVGIRQVGAGNFNPGPFNTYQGGAGGWMTSHVESLAATPAVLGLNDKNNLSASGGRGDGDYDALAPGNVVSPFGTSTSYGLWFDRDGVDPFQATYWGAVNGGTYNTGGVYDIVITYHAIDAGLGTMFATVNGVQQGFYPGAWQNAQPGLYPAGLSFTGDMANMQVFYGMWAPNGGSVTISDLSVTGVVPDGGMTLTLLGCALVGLGALRRKFRG